MKLLNLGCLATSNFILAIFSTPAQGFTLDLFTDSNTNNTADLYNTSGVLLLSNFPVTGQSVYVNQDVSAGGFLYTSENTDIDLNDVVGGDRHLKISTTSGSNVASLETGTTQTSGILNLNTNSNATSVGQVVWNGSDSIDYGNLADDAALNIDLEADADGDDSIGINVNFADQGGTLNLTLFDGTNTYPYAQPIPVVNSGSTHTLYYDFATYQENSVDINNIQYISMEITGPAASDIELNFLETTKNIPFGFSPSLGLIVGGTCLGFNIWNNKQKIASASKFSDF